MSGEYAPRSVLKAVIVIQKIGKKKSAAMNQPNTASPSLTQGDVCILICRLLSVLLKVLCEHANQEEGNNVSQDYCQNPAGGCDPGIELVDTERVDQIG